MKTASLLLLGVSLFAFTACSEDDDDSSSNQGNLELNLSQLAQVEADEVYEGWIIVDGAPVSTGTFTVDDAGVLSRTRFTVDEADLAAATDFVLSIEPKQDNDPAPSDIKILGGAFNGDEAMVSAAHPAALNADLSNAMGTYLLATPTTSDMTDELSGVWFLDGSNGSAGLDLPALPANWIYEGWAVINGTPVSTGRFSDPSVADLDAPFSGTDAGSPPFPGEDFVMNAPNGLTFPVDLAGMPLVISIEPNPDNSEAPFAFKPLFTMAGAMDHVNYPIENQVASNFPTGSVSR
ncbi:anti-sigma factor [Cryomorphaceae bacterium]|nr:anti-sigma factor [Cryomorphaceae bacterium]